MNTPRDLAIPLERITWRDGQTLTSSDLRDDQLLVERLRHLHIRYQHKTWGVVDGLQVIALGVSSIAVSKGYALDIEGRELLLPAVTRVAAPTNVAASRTMYLTISRNTTSTGCAGTPDLATLCPGVRNPIPIEQGLLSWKTVTEVRLGKDVLLARVLIAGGRVASAVDTSVQRFAATLDQPLIWSDATLAGQTGWTDAQDPEPVIWATVDTSDAGFVATPAYFAHLAGTSQVTVGFISAASAASFTFVVRYTSTGPGAGGQTEAAAAESAGWIITWLGIELRGN
jgi:hypothetical protein